MCFDSCLRGRQGQCCFGCSTRLGINLTAVLTLLETTLIGYIFLNEMSDGIFNLKVFSWLFLVVFRLIAYFVMCCDSISNRKFFMYSLVGTTFLEGIMFTILNIGLFDGTDEEIAFRALKAWGLTEWVQIFFVEVFSLIHLILFCYLCAVAYEYYAMARDDP